MLYYFVRYRDFIKANLFVAFPSLYTPVIGLESSVSRKAESAFDARLRARLEAAQ
jgi:hypothetical protein